MLFIKMGFPGGSLVKKNSAANAGDPNLIPGSGRSPGERNGNPLQCSCLGNPMDGGTWRATVRRVAKESDTTQPLNSNREKADQLGEKGPSCTVGGNVNWCRHYGEQYGGSFKTQKQSYRMMEQSHSWAYQLEETITRRDTRPLVLIAAQFTIAGTWK